MKRATGYVARALMIAMVAAIPAHAADGPVGQGAFEGDTPRVRARLIALTEEGGGDAVRLGVLFDIDPGWHIYWRNPGETGLPTELTWNVEGARVEPTAWPAPIRFADPEDELPSYGYADRVLLSTRAHFAKPQRERIARVEASILACSDQCIPADFSLSLPLDAQPPAGIDVIALFQEAASRVPIPASDTRLELEARYSQSAIRPGDSFEAAVAVRSCAGDRDCEAPSAAEFFPEASGSLQIQMTRELAHPSDPSWRLVVLRGRARSNDAPLQERLQGVLSVRDSQGAPLHVNVDLPLPRAAAGAAVAQLDGAAWLAPTAPTARLGLGRALALALLGGLILNLMPCVLPVLAIKAFAVAELAQRSHKELIAHGIAYTVGILSSMTALALLVAGLRSAGSSVGWGFQFQEPAFLVAISAILVIFALNLFGAFEISLDTARLGNLGAQATGARRSFFEGLLAVALATPCSAPFLGTAVGFAFASPAPVIAVIFGAIGLGLASPYLLITLVPGWARFMPRSGPWMLRLRSVLGFALLGTVLWLMWVLGRSAGIDGVAAAMAVLLAVAFAAWLYGVAQETGRAHLRTAAGFGLILLALTGVNTVRIQAPERPGVQASAETLAYDPAALSAELERGRPALVYFTADWCITCAVNERMVLSDERVRAEMSRLDVDDGRQVHAAPAEAPRAELPRSGTAGVPMYLVYRPGAADDPILLPEVLTVDLVLDAIGSGENSARG